MRLVLASSSPRRKALLALTQVPFDVEAADIDETLQQDESPLLYVRRMALAKAQRVQQRHPDPRATWFLGCDTVVIHNGQVLGKPNHYDHAQTMLRQLSDDQHEVITAVALCGPEGWLRSFEQSTIVHFHPISEADIAAYWATGEPQDKAGSYAIQGVGARFVKQIMGQYHAVVGLPIDGLIQILDEAGFATWGPSHEQ